MRGGYEYSLDKEFERSTAGWIWTGFFFRGVLFAGEFQV